MSIEESLQGTMYWKLMQRAKVFEETYIDEFCVLADLIKDYLWFVENGDERTNEYLDQLLQFLHRLNNFRNWYIRAGEIASEIEKQVHYIMFWINMQLYRASIEDEWDCGLFRWYGYGGVVE